MKKTTHFVCSSCGEAFAKWSGRCESCQEWNTLVQFNESPQISSRKTSAKLETSTIGDVMTQEEKRIGSGHKVLDNLLGGGFVKGSVVLLAGEPGIGKSTLLMQVAAHVATSGKVLYVSGEESVHQIAIRAKRLGVSSDSLSLSNTASTDQIAEVFKPGAQSLVIVDSIQTVMLDSVASAPGSVSQITNSLAVLSRAAKQSGTALIVVGHVTKDGSIAGPKLLEHLVDVVLQFEGDRLGGLRLLRSVKNRFGSTNESVMYEMSDKGLEPVSNPSKALLDERQAADGSVVLATMQGTQPLLVEVQALVNTTHFGYPKRSGSGIDLNRLNILAAVLEKRTKLNLSDKDIYVNVVGGIRLADPGADLAIAMAIASAAKGYALKDDAVVFGEVGLSGEIRHVPFAERRVAEAKKLGFTTAIGPKSAAKSGAKTAVNLKDALNKFLVKS